MRAGSVDMSYLACVDEEATGGTNERADDEDAKGMLQGLIPKREGIHALGNPPSPP